MQSVRLLCNLPDIVGNPIPNPSIGGAESCGREAPTASEASHASEARHARSEAMRLVTVNCT